MQYNTIILPNKASLSELVEAINQKESLENKRRKEMRVERVLSAHTQHESGLLIPKKLARELNQQPNN
jgi:hypothetical protein